MEGAEIPLLDAPRPERVPAAVEDFLRMLGRPTVIHVPGRDRTRSRVVATLLHGNEPSGIRAVHAWLREGTLPAVDVRVFVAAVDAALAAPGFAHRALPGHRDLNRCFFPPYEGREARVAAGALARFREVRPEAIIDLHNTTGHSPAYGVAPRVGPPERALTALFARRLVHNSLRLCALVEATSPEFPSVTIECGRAGDADADSVARRGLERFLQADRVGVTDEASLQVLVDPVRVAVRSGATLVFGDNPDPSVDLTVACDLDRHNFESLSPGTLIGWTGDPDRGWPLEAHGADGEEVSRRLFSVGDGVIRTRRDLIPIMMTIDPAIARSDCLFYAVRRPSRGTKTQE